MEEGIVFADWHYWFVAAIILMVIEVFVPGFVLGCLAIGALGGMVASVFSEAIEVQLISASAVAGLGFLFIRPFALKRLFREDTLKTNTDSLVGRRARVSQAFDAELLKGRVAIDGDDWMAYSTSPGDFSNGAIVIIEKVESNTLIVKPLTEKQ